MIFKQEYPSIINGEFGYFQAVQELGYVRAHYQMLLELRAWFESHPFYARTPYTVAQEAYLIHQKFIKLLFRDQKDLPVVQTLEAQYAQVFGTSGRAVIGGVGPRLGVKLENRESRQGYSFPWRPRSKSEILRTIRST